MTSCHCRDLEMTQHGPCWALITDDYYIRWLTVPNRHSLPLLYKPALGLAA